MIRKKGIFSWYGFPTPIKMRFVLIKKAGFDSTMLWWGDGKAFAELEKSELVEEANKNCLLIENIHVPFENANDIWIDEKERRTAILDQYIDWIQDCSKFKIPMMVMHISKGYDIVKPTKNGLTAIEKLTREAENQDVKLALENTRNNTLLEYLLNNIHNKHLGLCYDTSHANLYGDDQFNLLEKYKKRLFCFHISDNDGKDDTHWQIGNGRVNWNAFIKKFPADYKGIISLEVYPKTNEESEKAFLNEAFGTLVNLESRLN